MAAVSWVSRSGGSTDKNACLLMRMTGRLELAGGWNHTAKHVPGVQNSLADGISRWPRGMLADIVREISHSSDWREQSIGPRRSRMFDIVLQTKNILIKHLHHRQTGGNFIYLFPFYHFCSAPAPGPRLSHTSSKRGTSGSVTRSLWA